MDEELVSAYLDGECTAAERIAVEGRLAASPEWRAVLAETAAVRDALRALPPRDAPPEFWARVLAEPRAAEAVGRGSVGPIDLVARRSQRRPVRWLAAAVGAAVAATFAAIVLVPEPRPVDPPVAAFTDAHAVRSSLHADAVSALAPLAVPAELAR